MAEIKGMWLQEPDPSTPDVVAVGHWKCEKCGVGRSIVTSTWSAVSLRFKCYCGTDVEITPAELIDGSLCPIQGPHDCIRSDHGSR